MILIDRDDYRTIYPIDPPICEQSDCSHTAVFEMKGHPLCYKHAAAKALHILVETR